MLNWISKSLNGSLLVACISFACVNTALAQNRSALRHKQQRANPAPEKTTTTVEGAEAKIIGTQIHFADGSTVQADEVWKNGDDLWYRIGGVTQRVARAVKSVEPIHAPVEKAAEQVADASKVQDTAKPPATGSFWVLLKGGARMKADDVTESEEGAWCRRGNFSVLIASDRIERIERESTLANQPGWKKRDWTTGNNRIDQLIRANGSRFGVDPYLVFCVIEHESQFRTKAVSPKGAQGLMQLMPATASRFGVRNPFDPGENIFGGTQYLKELLKMFSGRVDLALASYNAGEGAVLKYGRNVPPYRETREYVRRITRRYGTTSETDSKTPPSQQ